MIRNWMSATLGAALALLPLGASLQAQEAEADTDVVAEPVVEPEALFALKRMGEYLRSLDTFRVTADTTQDEVANRGVSLTDLLTLRLASKGRRSLFGPWFSKLMTSTL